MFLPPGCFHSFRSFWLSQLISRTDWGVICRTTTNLARISFFSNTSCIQTKNHASFNYLFVLSCTKHIYKCTLHVPLIFFLKDVHYNPVQCLTWRSWLWTTLAQRKVCWSDSNPDSSVSSTSSPFSINTLKQQYITQFTSHFITP